MPDKRGYLYEGETEVTSLNIDLERGVVEQLEAFARAQGRSRSWMANRLIRAGLGMVDAEIATKRTK